MEPIKKTCLNEIHRQMGALMSPFGGFDMPIEYSGIVDEHNAVRQRVGVFDVSHMGEVLVHGADTVKFINHIFTNDVSTLADGAIIYGMMLNDKGGTVDDLLVYRRSDDEMLMVINAGNIDKDVAWIFDHAKDFDVVVEDLCDSYGELAIQGPLSEETLKNVLAIDASDLTFYTFKDMELNGEKIIVSRTGYTGEDGFEVYASPALTVKFWQALIAAGVTPCGLGCRDTLRFEAGLPLYGDELGEDITPVEASLSMFVKLDKPDFIGRQVIADQKANGVSRRLVGLEIHAPAIARHGYEVLDQDENVVGVITTGYRSITLGKSLAMAFVNTPLNKLDTPLKVRVRRHVFDATVIKKRFYSPNYKK